MNGSIFRKTSLEKISSPDKLDSYLKISHIPMWILLIALLIVMIGSIIWCFYGSMATTVSSYGIIKDNMTFCFVPPDEAYSLKKGMAVQVLPQGINDDKHGAVSGTIKEISQKPIEALEELSKHDALWLNDKIDNQWIKTVTVVLNVDEINFTLEQNHLCFVNIITKEVRPIDMVFGN